MTHDYTVSFVIKVDEDNNLLSSLQEAHKEHIEELVLNMFYDVDDVTISKLLVRDRP